MEKAYKPQEHEEKIYQFWEKGGYFTPKIDPDKKPYSILLPLPNANDPLHIGHALFTVQDILVRYHRMLGKPTLWLPGGDHAGIETQFVFEKHLRKEGKSRFDFDRKTLYKKISSFVEKNKDLNRNQLKKMGFSLDWSRYHYSLEKEIVDKILGTFRKLHADGLVYRDERLVNYCINCGTAFSDLEVVYQEKKAPLYYLKYGPFVLATTRPETKFGDTAVAVHPDDKRYQEWIGKEFTYQSLIGPRKMKVVADQVVDPEFGTGVVKITPAHDPNDFEISQRHNLDIIKVINFKGKLTKKAGRFASLTIKEARKQVVSELKEKGDLVKIDQNYTHRIGTCYRCKKVIEPMLMPQWFVKAKPLAEPAIEAVKKGKTKIVPKKRFEKMYFDWMENIRDWNISRQIVWGPQIPAWYCLECHPEIRLDFVNKDGERVSGTYQKLKKDYKIEEIKKGIQQLTAPKETGYFLENKSCPKCHGKKVLQETDTFDTWFLSGQWPLTALGYPDEKDFHYFYPTSVLDTMWDILFFWVARMMMFGLYLTDNVPFETVHLHARVVDKHGRKMSKSKGNVINLIKMIEKHGTDALRMALIIGVSPGSDIALSDDKIRAMRNFANKIWNIGRFILLSQKKVEKEKSQVKPTTEDKKILKEANQLIKKVTDFINRYRFDLAADALYHFLWHRFADEYIEYSKDRIQKNDPTVLAILSQIYLDCLKLLHPFMPFITEVIWQKMKQKNDSESIMVAPWPKLKKDPYALRL